MSVSGRINIDALVHDTTSGTALHVIGLESSESVTAGKVAIMTGSCGTAGVSIGIAPSDYIDSSGDDVSFASVTRVIMQGSSALKFTCPSVTAYSGATQCAAFSLLGHTTGAVSIAAVAGTATYTVILVGT